MLMLFAIGISLNSGCNSVSSQIADQNQNELTALQSELEAAQSLIKSLESVNADSTTKIESLQTELEAVKEELAQAQQQLVKQVGAGKALQANLEKSLLELSETAEIASKRQKTIDAAIQILQNSIEPPSSDE